MVSTTCASVCKCGRKFAVLLQGYDVVACRSFVCTLISDDASPCAAASTSGPTAPRATPAYAMPVHAMPAYATPACVPAIRRVTPDAGRAVSPTTPLATCSAEAATRH
eukprot:scaffold77177_cov56-Phaeocystis_antarctica.AAC.3